MVSTRKKIKQGNRTESKWEKLGQVDKIDREGSPKKTLLNNDLLSQQEKDMEKRIPKVGRAEGVRNSKEASGR